MPVTQSTSVSASPELFFELRNNDILMRPMKGTAARGRTSDEDAAAVRALSSNSKERAENIMIVDLIRNDMAAIAEVGTVRVTALCRPERYETIHQLTSDVRARLRPDCGLVDIFRALFPCGSVTGAPKNSTMQIIADLEDEPRGVYCGAIGVVAPPQESTRARFSVAIRTVVVDRIRGTATYGTGGGVTWASDPAAEHAEAMTKAAILRSNTADFQLVEFIRWERGRGPVRLEAHLARLARSALYFGFSYRAESVYAAITSQMRDRVPDSEAARIRLTLSRDGQVGVSVGPCPEPAQDPVTLAIDHEPLDSRECWPYHKTTRRQPYERRLARHRADDVVLINERGEVTSSCTANLAALIGGQWWTPPVDSGCIAGVGRAVLVESQFLTERTLTPADLLGASSVALISSVRGWQPAVLVADEMRRLA
jgi:para-aminobenzoate synthetase/4-amino-4-deoxychorismate lyase